jgi:hypothetical protein
MNTGHHADLFTSLPVKLHAWNIPGKLGANRTASVPLMPARLDTGLGLKVNLGKKGGSN